MNGSPEAAQLVDKISAPSPPPSPLSSSSHSSSTTHSKKGEGGGGEEALTADCYIETIDAIRYQRFIRVAQFHKSSLSVLLLLLWLLLLSALNVRR